MYFESQTKQLLDEHIKMKLIVMKAEANIEEDYQTRHDLDMLLHGINEGDHVEAFKIFKNKGYELNLEQKETTYKQEGEVFTASTPMPTLVLKKLLYKS